MQGLLVDIFLYMYNGSRVILQHDSLFVNAMLTISAVSFLASVTTKPLSLVISMFEAHMLFEASAFVALLILGTNILFKLCIEGYKKYSLRA